ncbi:tetratricopeptide repeat protein [Ramlibacter sp.]|uniref:tetratricopeptide repeat protein n=1 Tax=Ramlibacter sp. TaxID=1917967 RepID=UPI002CF620E4|nr:tetratricopeptide repeat protein [Ramlibacter sp.]HWI80721.1 tetratricopeptide repeat protein [Ramlibacter sp.]
MLAPVRILLAVIAVLFTHPAAAQDVKHHAKGAVELGWSYFNKGDTETALKRFNQALILDPNFAPAYFGIAYVYSVQNKLDLAIQNYRKSIEKDPTFSHSYSNLGLALLYSGNPKEALQHLKKALDIDPKNGDAHVNIALYYFDAGDYSSSWKHIHSAQAYKANVKPNFLRDLKAKLPEPPRGTGG